jgi:microcystin-dependent protein
MTALNFPTTPTDRETYEGFYWDATLGVWRSDPIPMGGLPAGSVMQWLTNTPPANWAVADGSLRSRVTDASLFAIIGTTYGVGDGTTTFALPDLRGRVPVGKDAGTFGALAGTGGAETHTLTEAQMPLHNHSGSTGDSGTHNHGGINNSTSSSGGNNGNVIRDGGASFNLISFQGGNHSHDFTTNNTGGDSAHNNLQPFLVVNYIIKLSSGWSAGDSELATRLGVAEAKVVSLEAERKGTPGQPFAMAAGTVGATNGTTIITFPAGRFTQSPIVQFTPSWVSANGNPTTGWPVIPYPSAPTSSAVGVQLTNNSGSAGVHWVAIQMTSTSGAG